MEESQRYEGRERERNEMLPLRLQMRAGGGGGVVVVVGRGVLRKGASFHTEDGGRALLLCEEG